MPEQERFEVPEPMTLVGFSVQVRPEVGEMVSDRATALPNPSTAVIVRADVPLEPDNTVRLVGLALIVKS